MNPSHTTSHPGPLCARLEVLVRAQVRSASCAAAERGATVDMTIRGDVRPVRADGFRVCEAVGRVLMNAVDRSAFGGRVRVRIDFGETQAAVSAALDGVSHAGASLDGSLDSGLAAARRVFEDYGGALRWVGRELIASLDYGV